MVGRGRNNRAADIGAPGPASRGDGEPHTVSGQLINIFDDLGIQEVAGRRGAPCAPPRPQGSQQYQSSVLSPHFIGPLSLHFLNAVSVGGMGTAVQTTAWPRVGTYAAQSASISEVGSAHSHGSAHTEKTGSPSHWLTPVPLSVMVEPSPLVPPLPPSLPVELLPPLPPSLLVELLPPLPASLLAESPSLIPPVCS
jgi:hypothetical protein